MSRVRVEPFLAPAPLVARAAPWAQSGLVLTLSAGALAAALTLAAYLAPASADERGVVDLIELSALEMTTQSEAQEEAAAAPEQTEQSTTHVDEQKSKTQTDERPQEMASPTEPIEEDLRLAQEKTRETTETQAEQKPTTEAQEAKDAPAPSQASLAAEKSEAVAGEDRDATSSAPDIGVSREGERRLDEWRRRLLAHIGKHRFYPPQARKQGLKGEALVAFTLDAQGRIAGARVERSSGSKTLDEAALEVLRRADPAPIPPSGAATPMALALPLRFALK